MTASKGNSDANRHNGAMATGDESVSLSYLDRDRERLLETHAKLAAEIIGSGVSLTIPACRGFGSLDWVGFPSQFQRGRVIATTSDCVFVIKGDFGVGMKAIESVAPRDSIRAERLTRLYGRVNVNGRQLFVHRRFFDLVHRAVEP